jgi:putative flavoprotein involved in K+ transport
VRGERANFTVSVLDHIVYADTVAAMLAAKADSYIAAQGISAPDPEPAPGANSCQPESITELDLAGAGVTSVIWATGFSGDLSWVHLPILDADGHLKHAGCAAPVPGLWYIGFPWLTRRQSGILHGLPTDAGEVVTAVLRHLSVAI